MYLVHLVDSKMGNGSSSSQADREEQEHTYEEIREEGGRFLRNSSIVTLDIKPGEWRRLAGSREEARDVWEGGEAREGHRGGWRDHLKEEQTSKYKRCVSLDIKQLTNSDGSDF